MPRESKQDLRRRAAVVTQRLRKAYPRAKTALTHDSPFQLLVATILSAQCTDERVNRVTPTLFARFPRPADLAEADREEVEEIIRSTGFYRNKAKSIQAACRKIVSDYGGDLPRNMEHLLTLPGVARKTANVVTGNAMGLTTGIVVDTHVFRLSHRLGLSKGKNPEQVERDLMALVPEKEWIGLGNRLIAHGRAVCLARKPDCAACVVESLCPRIGVPGSRPSRTATSRRQPLGKRIGKSQRRSGGRRRK